jgi:hypothetical protein
MSTRPKFYLPVILPPSKDQSDPPAYYAGIKNLGIEVTADSPAGLGSLEITITNSDQLHPSDQFDQPVAVSTVLAPTSGFVRFYPGSAALPVLDQQPMTPPSGLSSADIGSAVIRVWISSFVDFMKAPAAAAPRANRIVLGWLEPSTVETAFAAEIAKLKDKVLKRAWEDADGTGDVPDRADLEEAFLQRFMAGHAEIFVSAGTVLGSAISSPSNVAQVKLQAFFEPSDLMPSLPIEAEELIDSGLQGSKASTKTLFNGHPLLEAVNAEIGIHFRARFTIWDNSQFRYIPFANKDVRLMKAGAGELDRATTDISGTIDMTVPPTAQLKKRDMIHFEYATFGEKFGNRDFTEDIVTDSHRARQYVNGASENTREYKAKYEFHSKYEAFVKDLSSNMGSSEKFGKDRGNTDREGNFLQTIKNSEQLYKGDKLPQMMFTVLFEGDSWLHYPIAVRGHIYNHLDTMFGREKKQGVTYNAFPLQHYGDRSEQMFFGEPHPSKTDSQWKFTTDLLSEYKINLIVCSCGGNDFAEPGIENQNDKERFEDYFITETDSKTREYHYFDPFAAKGKLGLEQQPVQQLIERSFAALLKNHRWNFYLNDRTEAETKKEQRDEFDLYTDLDQQLIALQKDFGESDPDKQSSNLESIGKKVIDNFTLKNDFDLPNPHGDQWQRLLATVFDSDRYRARLDKVKDHWLVLLKAAKERNIRVVTHSYCYPLFNENPSTVFGWGWTPRAGPWFVPRFEEARIIDRRIRRICLKAMIDNYVGYILQPLKDNNEYKDTFDYVNVRDLNVDAASWHDEMHLTAAGFEHVATRMYDSIKVRFPEYLK